MLQEENSVSGGESAGQYVCVCDESKAAPTKTKARASPVSSFHYADII